tara:strand:+ start:32 stop:1024 length:993 start_codon:yes stop_codon:yes gene_type:complete
MAKKKNFDPNKPPKLKSGESASSFRERVKNWEEVTGKKATYADSLMSASKENRILQGEGTLGIGTDYTRQEDYIDSYNTARTRKRLQDDPSGSTEEEQQDKGTDLRNLYGMDDDVDPGDIMGLTSLPTDKALASLTAQSDERLAETTTTTDNTNPWMPKASYNVAMQGGNNVFIGNDTDKVNAAEFQKVAYAADQRTKLSETGGQEYVTDYQTAIRNSRRDGLSFGEAEQYYGEDVLDSAGQRVRKSNVFTENEDGDPMGVMSRKQRLAYDLKMQEARMPKTDKTEVKTDQDKVTTEKTGKILDTAGTPTGVIEPVTKSPLSDLFDDRIG